MRFLVDTNVLTEPTKASPDSAVLDALRRHSEEIATASVVWHELWFGVTRLSEGRRRKDLRRYLDALQSSTMPILPYDSAAAVWHADQRAALETRGRPAPFADGQIAAIAATNDLVLVTRNTADFEPFGIDVSSWWDDVS